MEFRQLQGKRILLVEDDTLIAMDIAMSLQDQGYTVSGPVRNEAEAFDLLTRETPDIAILDVHLGRDTDSFGIAKELRHRNIPLFFLTGYSEATIDVPDTLVGTTRLGKPVATKHLLRTIEAELAD